MFKVFMGAGQAGIGCGSKVKHKGEGQKVDQKPKLQDRVEHGGPPF
jgi:hypothetical protein